MPDKEEAERYYAKRTERTPINNNIRIREREDESPIANVQVLRIAKNPFTKNSLKEEKEDKINIEFQNDDNNMDNDVVELVEDPLAVDGDLLDSSSTLNTSALTTTTSTICTPGSGRDEPIKIDLSSLFKRRKSQRTKEARKSSKSNSDKASTNPNRSQRGHGKSTRSPKGLNSPDSGVEIIIEEDEEVFSSVPATKKYITKNVQKNKAGRLAVRSTLRKKGVKSDDSFGEIQVISATNFGSIQGRPNAGKDKVTDTNSCNNSIASFNPNFLINSL